MKEILLIISILSTTISYLVILLLTLSKKTSKSTAKEAVIKLTKDDNSIHLVESKDSYLNKYQIKRKMIKLKTKTYNSNKIFDVSIAYLFSGYTKLDNNIINNIGKIIPYIYSISLTPIITIIISSIINTSMDAKIGIIILLIIGIYQYIIYEQNIKAKEQIKIKDKNIEECLNKIILVSKIFFIITSLQILRMLLIV